MTASNRGRFIVSREFFYSLGSGDGANLFKDMVVLQTQTQFETGNTEYIAVHPHFDPVPEGCVSPRYEARFDSGAIYPNWVKVEEGVHV
jgi:hypothetical protein